MKTSTTYYTSYCLWFTNSTVCKQITARVFRPFLTYYIQSLMRVETGCHNRDHQYKWQTQLISKGS